MIIELYPSCCGDETCNCHYITLYKKINSSRNYELWTSNYRSWDYDVDEQLREELRQACKELNIPFEKFNTESTCIFDWGCEIEC